MSARAMIAALARLPSTLAIGLVRLYQLTLSPLLGPTCRFTPSCSRYCVACLRDHGLMRGSWLTLRRLSRCHPWHPGGYDPPPLPSEPSSAAVGNPSPSRSVGAPPSSPPAASASERDR